MPAGRAVHRRDIADGESERVQPERGPGGQPVGAAEITLDRAVPDAFTELFDGCGTGALGGSGGDLLDADARDVHETVDGQARQRRPSAARGRDSSPGRAHRHRRDLEREGAIGFVDNDRGTARLAVGIRTFWATREDDARWLRFGTGAGITWASDPEGEWRECELKARVLVGLASGRVVT